MPLNVQYHKHPALHFSLERTWFILLVSESRTPRKKFTSLTLNEQQCGSQSHGKKNPKSERAVKRG